MRSRGTVRTVNAQPARRIDKKNRMTRKRVNGEVEKKGRNMYKKEARLPDFPPPCVCWLVEARRTESSHARPTLDRSGPKERAFCSGFRRLSTLHHQLLPVSLSGTARSIDPLSALVMNIITFIRWTGRIGSENGAAGRGHIINDQTLLCPRRCLMARPIRRQRTVNHQEMDRKRQAMVVSYGHYHINGLTNEIQSTIVIHVLSSFWPNAVIGCREKVENNLLRRSIGFKSRQRILKDQPIE